MKLCFISFNDYEQGKT